MNNTTTAATPTPPEPTVTADMSYWKMGKHLFAGLFNTTLNITDGVNHYASAFNEVGQATNAMARVVKDYALVEETEAIGLLKEKRRELA